MINTKKKKFVLIIKGYSPDMYVWQPEEKYHLHALKVAKNMGYETNVLIKSGLDNIKGDPDFDKETNVIEYKSTLIFIKEIILFAINNSVIYANSYEIESLIAPLFSRKVIFMSHGQSKRDSFIQQKIQNLIYKLFKKIRLINITEKKFLISQNINIDKLCIVPLPIAVNIFRKNTQEVTSQDIVYFGNVTPVKDLLTILKAVKILRDNKYGSKLHIIGNISDLNFWDTAKNIGVDNEIIYHGYVPQIEASTLLSNFPICVNSSLKEGQCLSIYQATLAGCALCLPNIMSFIDVFKDIALFHDTGDYKTLTKNIIFYLENPAYRVNHVKLCQDMISKNYSKEIIEPKMKKLFTI